MKTIASIDIGTNSVRLGVHRISEAHECNTLAVHKEVVRLGQGEFSHNRITEQAIDHGLLVIKKFVDIARSYDASGIIAVATAALREAANRDEFVERAHEECGIDIKVVSGLEEARLIYLGIASGVEINSTRALFVDIGGGTTELIIGDAKDYFFLDSLKLGAIRLADIFLRGKTGSVSKKRYRNMVDYARGAAIHASREIKEHGFELAFGSSGTIMNLAEITARRLGHDVANIRNYCLQYADLSDTISYLCSLNLNERRSVSGINPERADIIVSGAAVLDAMMSSVGATGITISDRALRDGILIDYLFQKRSAREQYTNTSPRERSILQLCRACNYEKMHSDKTVQLSTSIYRQLGSLGFHPYSGYEEELLKYSAMVHDVGTFISRGDHHKHTYYIVRNWNLLGFSDEEVEIIATSALCHRKAPPKKAAARRLSTKSMRLVETLSSIIRVADALDRSQMGLVREVVCRYEPSNNVIALDIAATDDCVLELRWLDNKKRLFEHIFEVELRPNLTVI